MQITTDSEEAQFQDSSLDSPLVESPLIAAIQKALARVGENGLAVQDLVTVLGVELGDKRLIRNAVKTLLREGIVERAGRRYRIAPRGDAVQGTIKFQRNGHAILTLDTGEKFFVPRFLTGGLQEGDKVRAQRVEAAPQQPPSRHAAPSRAEKSAPRDADPRQLPEVRAVTLIERPPQRIAGTFQNRQRVFGIEPENTAYGHFIPIDPRSLPPVARLPEEGELVFVEINIVGTSDARFVKRLGKQGSYGAEVARLMAANKLPDTHPEAALAEAARAPQKVSAAERKGREDMTHLPFVTIDGEDARDFDDAVCAQKLADGYRLFVAIADVSHYVTPGSAIDTEARARGTSVYLPHRAIHMLPEALSAGICSLLPHTPRLALAAVIDFDLAGTPRAERFAPIVFESRHRLTYRQVEHKFYGGEKPDPDFPKDASDETLQSLATCVELASVLRAARFRRGSLDFNLAEPKVIFHGALEHPDLPPPDTFDVETVGKRDRLEAHKLIEEMMLAANEAVGRFIAAHNVPGIWRIHEPPDEEKLDKFIHRAEAVGAVPDTVRPYLRTPRGLQAVLDALRDSPAERPLNMLLLRAMMQARYSEHNVGHFALAAPYYVHFTSPIRRYPDLIIHRVLRYLLDADGALEDDAEAIAAACSRNERRAMESEREALNLCRSLLARTLIGETFESTVVGVAEFGLFVEIEDPYLDGLIPISSLGNDYFVYDGDEEALVGRRSKERFAVGDRLTVTLVDANVSRRQVAFNIDRNVRRVREAAVATRNRRDRDEPYPSSRAQTSSRPHTSSRAKDSSRAIDPPRAKAPAHPASPYATEAWFTLPVERISGRVVSKVVSPLPDDRDTDDVPVAKPVPPPRYEARTPAPASNRDDRNDHNDRNDRPSMDDYFEPAPRRGALPPQIGANRTRPAATRAARASDPYRAPAPSADAPPRVQLRSSHRSVLKPGARESDHGEGGSTRNRNPSSPGAGGKPPSSRKR